MKIIKILTLLMAQRKNIAQALVLLVEGAETLAATTYWTDHDDQRVARAKPHILRLAKLLGATEKTDTATININCHRHDCYLGRLSNHCYAHGKQGRGG